MTPDEAWAALEADRRLDGRARRAIAEHRAEIEDAIRVDESAKWRAGYDAQAQVHRQYVAAIRASEPLDVERLAEALFRSQAERTKDGGLGSHEADAACIAHEYAALGEKP